MAASIDQFPGEYNLGFGVNPVTLSGILPGEDKYVLQIRNRLGTVTFADVRQTPNLAGVALFDIQAILQNILELQPIGIEDTINWTPGGSETLEYRIYWGTETAGVATIDGNVSGLKVLSGRKAPADLFWTGQFAYRYRTSQTGLCTNIVDRGLLLTDWTSGGLSQNLGVIRPPRVQSGVPTLVQELRLSDAYSVSFIQEPIKQGTVTANGIVGAWVTAYNAAGAQIGDVFIDNTTALGGGPDTTPAQNLPLVNPYWTMTFPLGPAGSEVADQINIPGAAYYWVTFHTLTDPSCATSGLVWNTTTSQWEAQSTIWNNIPGISGVADDPAFTPLLIKITPGECNDYNPIQLSWMNSFGFRDYWTFAKRREREIPIQRNEYYASPIDYNATSVGILSGGRGRRTSSQQLEDKYTITTNWLNDAEAAYLENLFISPDVRANLGDGFRSVTLLNTSYVEKTVRKDQMFQYEIQFKTAYNINSQRG